MMCDDRGILFNQERRGEECVTPVVAVVTAESPACTITSVDARHHGASLSEQ